MANQLQRNLSAEQRRTAEQTPCAERAENIVADQSRQLWEMQTLLEDSERVREELFADVN